MSLLAFLHVTGMERSSQELKAKFTFRAMCGWIPAASNIVCVAHQVTYYETMCMVMLSKVNVHMILFLQGNVMDTAFIFHYTVSAKLPNMS